MAGVTSWIISNLLSSLERLSQFMPPLSSSSSSSSTVGEEVTAAGVNLIQERLLEDLSRLSRMLRRLQAVLHDAEREISDKAIQLWLTELKDVAYDAEDVLDQYDYQVIKAQVEGMTIEIEPSLMRKRIDDDEQDDNFGYQVPLPSTTSLKIPISCNLAMRIFKIMERFNEIAKDREALWLRSEDAPKRLCLDEATKRPMSSSLVHDSDVFGRDDEKKKIIQILMSRSEKENIVIPIVGMGGVGKTTLAKLIYNDRVVCRNFSPKVWVCVSEYFDVLRITKEILTSIVGLSNHNNNNNLNDLQCMLKEALLEKRFLLVLDDIWNERPDMWEVLRVPFYGIGLGKIIVTTRSMSVARIMQTMPPHELGCLDEETSWLLFKRHAFCGWELYHQLKFEQIGRGITNKCGGFPLALKAIGGFLRYEVEEYIWKNLLNNNLWESEETKNLILPALRISYNHLPAQLKPCFVYASLFPKDHEFEKEEMIRLWIAQGYIQFTGRKRLLEDIASEIFEDLVRRSLFQCSKYDERFTLHDMVHDLAQSINKNEICSSLDFDELENIPKDAKHIFIQYANLDQVLSFGAIRTLLYNVTSFQLCKELPQSVFFKNSFNHFGCLCVLTLYAPMFECSLQFVDWIGNLVQLRYLFIHELAIQIEKYSLCSLYKLQTLKLQSLDLNMPPHGIGKLINLRHLLIHCKTPKMLPKSFFGLENLLTLDFNFFGNAFSTPYKIERMASHLILPHYNFGRDGQYSGIGWLKHLRNLHGSLKIYELQKVLNYEDAKSANLQCKSNIESLTLTWGNRDYDECTRQEEDILDGLQPHTNLKELTIDGYGGSSFPSWFGSPHFFNLMKVSLINFNNDKECMFLPLSRLPSLISLDIVQNDGIRRMAQKFWCYPPPDGHDQNNSTKVHEAFHSLEYLKNRSMPRWKECPMVKNQKFSSLKHLYILQCQNLELLSTLPSSLEEFEVHYCERIKYLALYDISGPLSGLQKVTINNCRNLKLVNGLNNLLTTLKFLKLRECHLLKPNLDEYSDHSLESDSFEQVTTCVIKCPGMREWCKWYGLTYKETFHPTVTSAYWSSH